MSTQTSSLQRVVRRARRLPGYRRLRRGILIRLRTSETAKDIVSRVYSGADPRRKRLPQTYPNPGTLMGGLGAETLPVAVVSLLEVPAEKVDDIVADVARLQQMSAAFRPVFVLDSPRLDALRPYGYVGELLVSADDWSFTDVRWSDYATRRMSDIYRRYGAALSVTVPADGVNDAVRIMLQARSPY